LRGSGERHTAQAQATVGTPIEVPEPRTITRMSLVVSGWNGAAVFARNDATDYS
jgi:hypothetical protein